MVEAIVNFFKELISNPYLVVLVISLLPLIELRGAIPVGFAMFISSGVNAEVALLNSFLIAFVGSSIICPILYLVLEWFLALLEKIKPFKKLINKIRHHFNKKAIKLKEEVEQGTKNIEDLKVYENKLNKLYFWGLFTFVAIPLPLTGVYTGSAVGVFAKIKFKKALPPIILGNLTAGIIISLISYLFGVFI